MTHRINDESVQAIYHWHLIDTAPIDGTWVLAVSQCDKYSTRIYSTFFDGKNWIEMRSGSHHSWHPTHWMKYPDTTNSKLVS